MSKVTVLDRFLSKIYFSDDGCWLWRAFVTDNGYGRLRVGTTMAYAHRVSHQLLVGPIPPAMTIDHLCRVRRCVNPDHLEVVSQRENILRAQPLKGACSKGHAFSETNTYVTAGGSRQCRTCKAVAQRAYKHRRAA